MNLPKFEKKVSEFGIEQGWIPQTIDGTSQHTFFVVQTLSQYGERTVEFSTVCENVHFVCTLKGRELESLFDKLYTMIKIGCTLIPKTKTKKDKAGK